MGDSRVNACFDISQTGKLIGEMKQIMLRHNADFQNELKETMKNYGIDFIIMKNFIEYSDDKELIKSTKEKIRNLYSSLAY